jgi:hypothetical protein
MSRPVYFATNGQAHQLRAATAGLGAGSPVLLRTKDGRAFRFESFEVKQEADEHGKPTSLPRLVITIEELPPSTNTGPTSPAGKSTPPGGPPVESKPTATSAEDSVNSASAGPPPPELFDGTYPLPAERKVRLANDRVPNAKDG